MAKHKSKIKSIVPQEPGSFGHQYCEICGGLHHDPKVRVFNIYKRDGFLHSLCEPCVQQIAAAAKGE